MRRRRFALLILLVALLAAGSATIHRALRTAPDDGRPASPPPSASPAKAPAVRKAATSGGEPSVEAAAHAPGEPVDLDAADRDRDLHGVVVTKDGSPVAGAEIVAFAFPWRRTDFLTAGGYDDTSDGPRTRSAPDGTFAIRLHRGERRALRVTAAGFPTLRTTERLAGERARIVLEKGVRLRVTAVDEANRVVAGVRIRIWRTGGPAGTSVALEAVTSADGDAVFEGLPPQSALTLELLSTSGAGNPGWVDVAVGDGPDETFRLELPAGRTLTGRVVDDATGAPVARARVGMNWVLDVPTLTDADGRFSLPGWTGRGIEDIHVLAEGYARWSQVVRDASEFEVRLRRGFEATGRIVDPGGRPLPGALVNLVASEFASSEQQISIGHTRSDAAGRFRVTSLDPRLAHVLLVVADGYGRVRRRGAGPLAESSIDLGDVALAPGRYVAGMVLDAAGRPAARTQVTLRLVPGTDDAVLAENSYGLEEECRADDLGRFAFADVAPGRYELRARIEGGLPITEELVVSADSDAVGFTLREAESAGVEVRVVDERDVPLPGSWVFAESQGETRADGRTDARGVARLRIAADAAEVRVFAEANGRALLPCDAQHWAKGTAALTFVVREGDAVAGAVVDPDGRAVANAVLRFVVGAGAGEPHYADEAGRFRFVVPKGAEVRIVFDGVHRGQQPAFEGEAECRAPASDVVVRLRAVPSDGKLTVQVTTPDGDPQPGALVRLTSTSGRTRRVASTDAQGLATFESLLPNMRSVRVDGVGPWASSAEVETTPDGRQLVVALRRGAPIRVVVVGADGKPARAAVRIAHGPDAVAWGVTDEAGAYAAVVPLDVAGPFTVEARSESAPGRSGSAEDVSAGGADVRIVLSD